MFTYLLDFLKFQFTQAYLKFHHRVNMFSQPLTYYNKPNELTLIIQRHCSVGRIKIQMYALTTNQSLSIQSVWNIRLKKLKYAIYVKFFLKKVESKIQ